jgi:rubrerythrin
VQAAIDGEGHEFRVMYPSFVATAEAEGQKAALASFRNAMAVEQVHHDLYTRAFEAVRGGKDLEQAQIWVCPVCGDTFVGELPDTCPVCGAKREKFVEVK